MIVTLRTVLAERLFNDMAPADAKRHPGWLVAFGTVYGDGRGWWMENGFHPPLETRPAAPPLGVPLPVELDCGSDFTWNTDITPIAESHTYPVFALDGTAMLLRGILAATAAAGATTVRIGDDLLAVMAYGEPPPPGTAVLLRVRRLFLYPTHEPYE